MNTDKPLRVLSLGAGVQSSCIALMMEHGEIERADMMVFADTGSEPRAVYMWLEMLRGLCSIPIHTVMQADGLTKDIERACAKLTQRTSQPPMYTKPKGRIIRKCTRDFKIYPIYRHIQKVRAGRNVVQVFGISFDERHRMRTPDRKYILACEHPLVDMQITRDGCKRWMAAHGYPTPSRSACVYCPNRCNIEWQLMRDLAPDDWAEACRMDELMRHGLPGLRNAAYVHRQRVPLAEADLRGDIERGQGVLAGMGWADCEGMCGV